MGRVTRISQGIYKRGPKFVIDPKDEDGYRTKPLYFDTLEEAIEVRRVEVEKQKKRALIKKSRSDEEKRKDNLETFGNGHAMEREFAIALTRMDDRFKVMNDSTVADVILHAYECPEKALPIQIKTTSGPKKNQCNSCSFKDVGGYSGMPVVLWRTDTQEGWVFDGDVLNDRKESASEIKIAPGGKNAKLAKSGQDPLCMEKLVEYLFTIACEYTPVTEEEASWTFTSINHFKEWCTIYFYKTQVDPEASLPNAQNGSFDLVGSKGERIQQKTATCVQGRKALQVNLKEHCGSMNGVTKRRAYSSGSFDVLNVYYLDWKEKEVHSWTIPVQELEVRGFMRNEGCDGKMTLSVFFPFSFCDGETTMGPCHKWTLNFYNGWIPLQLPDVAEKCGASFLQKLRQ